jgi:hypothetical protein
MGGGGGRSEVREESKLCAPPAPLAPYILLAQRTLLSCPVSWLSGWLPAHSILLSSSGYHIGLEVSYPNLGISRLFSGSSRMRMDSTQTGLGRYSYTSNLVSIAYSDESQNSLKATNFSYIKQYSNQSGLTEYNSGVRLPLPTEKP